MISSYTDKYIISARRPSLPTLPAWLGAEPMTDSINALLLPLRRSNSAMVVTYAELLDYKPGRRGLVRYDVAAADGSEFWTVFGKFYTDVAQATRVHEIMKLLWGDIFANQSDLGVPQPLGYIPNPPMLLYLPIAGRFLNKRTPSDQMSQGMQQAGMWLAALHQHRPILDRQIQLDSELPKLESWSMLVGRIFADQAEAAMQLHRYLKEHADGLPLDSHVPIHKDFHYGHLIVNGRLNVIDFDEMRLGDANFDLAHFCAYLTLLVHRNNRTPLSYADLEKAFLGAYAKRTGWAPDQRFIYFYVYSCLKIAWQLCMGSGPNPRPQGQERHQQVRYILEQGLAAIANGLAESRSIGILEYLERSV